MSTRRTFLLALSLVLTTAVPAMARGPPGDTPATERVYDDEGRLLVERGTQPGAPDISYERVYRYVASDDRAHKPNHVPGGGGGGGDPKPGGTESPDPTNDCQETRFTKAAWHWTAPYSAYATSHADIFDAAGNAWDAWTSADVFGAVTPGAVGTAGVFDGVNQFDWVDLGSGRTIAVTITWYYTSTGEAVESDAQYNSFYPWSTTGAASAMDVANIGTHEIGHTFGLTHPNGPPQKIDCLTMYAYADFGETQKATLGVGDILGIRAVYGT